MHHTVAQQRVLQGEQHLDAFVKIARHPIGAAEKNFRLPTILEIIDAAVLEEPAYDAPHANAVAETANAWPQRTNAANDQLDINSGLRSTIERLNDIFIEQRIKLGGNPCWTAHARVLSLAINQRHTFFREIERRHHQRPIPWIFSVAGQKTQNASPGFGDFRIGREQADFRIDAGGSRVVIAGSEMRKFPGKAVS